MAKITKVPNGPLIKKDGTSLKHGGKIKKAQNGTTYSKTGDMYTATSRVKTPKGPRTYSGKSYNMNLAKELSQSKQYTNPADSIITSKPVIKKNGGKVVKKSIIKKAQTGDSIKPTLSPYMQKRAAQQIVRQKNIRLRDSVLNRQAAAQGRTREEMRSFQSSQKNKSDADVYDGQSKGFGKKQSGCSGSESANKKRREDEQNRKNGGIVKPGLWANIRNKAAENKKTGAKPKAPTAAMLKQERKIKSKK